ncbi:MAG: sugar phosphate isomerase/epimerase [Lachnospiraceae bacterium]|nr:sugar phosphate isomerase/epimerase [Lachnospiraceae bacterium]
MKISVSSYSFSQYIKAGKLTQADCPAKAKEMGFDAIEFIDIDGAPDLELQKKNAEAIKAAADKAGIEINAYTIGANLYKDTKEEMDAEVERLKGQLEIAKILGVTVMRHDACWSLGKKGASRSFDLMLPFIAENARKVTEYAETLGIRTCTENHGYIAQDSDRMERLFNAVNHDNYGLLVDIGNFICADEDPTKAVSRVAPYAIHVHLKDMLVRPEPTGSCRNMTRGGNYFCGTVVGEGDVPVKKCLRILKRAGYDGYVSLEYEGVEDCMAGIARGLANVKKILEEIG